MRQSIRIAAVLLLVAAVVRGDDTTSRLATIGRIWGAVKFAHPSLGYRTDIDWDAAAIRAAAAARTTTPLPDIIAEMLGTLGDPTTRVAGDCTEIGLPVPAQALFTELADGVVLLPYGTLSASLPSAAEDAVKAASVVVFDLRLPSGRCAQGQLPGFTDAARVMLKDPVTVPGLRKLFHDGYRSQDPNLDAGYRSRFIIESPTVEGSSSGTSASAIFIVDVRNVIPPEALALEFARRATVISVGPFIERITSAFLEMPIENGQHALIRTAELAYNGKLWSESALLTLPASASNESVLSAVLQIAQPRRHRAVVLMPPSTSTPISDYQWMPEATYISMRFPSFEYRALAAFRFWNVIHYFYAYLPLIGDWDARLPQIIDELTAATSQREYDLALAHVMTYVPDGHSQMYSPTWMALRGVYAPAFFIMPVEGKPVVVEVIDAAGAGPVQTGDELLAVDGRTVAERRAEMEPYMTAATDSAREFLLATFLAYGPAQDDATYTFKRPDGTTYDARLHRGLFTRTAPAKAWKILPGNIGYVDLRWLEATQVDTMISEMMGTRGLIIDIRNYPRAVFALLGRRLDTSGSSVVAQFGTPTVRGGVMNVDRFTQDIGTTSLPVYRGRTATLIDEQAISQSEHTCLVLEAVNRTTFVGSTTAGSNGDVTRGVLPGGIYFMFTGHDVRHADYRQLQRIGIVPDIPVPRTIEAASQHRDVVLERAIALLSQ